MESEEKTGESITAFLQHSPGTLSLGNGLLNLKKKKKFFFLPNFSGIWLETRGCSGTNLRFHDFQRPRGLGDDPTSRLLTLAAAEGLETDPQEPSATTGGLPSTDSGDRYTRGKILHLCGPVYSTDLYSLTAGKTPGSCSLSFSC